MANLQALRLSLLAVCAAVAPLFSGTIGNGTPEQAGMSAERLARVHEAMQRHIDANAISGAVTLVARNGRIVHFEAHGLIDIESKKAMTKDAIFRLASMTKPVTGVAVMLMVEEGKIRLSDPVAKYLPDFKDMKVAVAGSQGEVSFVPAQRQITIHDLLTHRSGLLSGGLGAKQAPQRAPNDTLATWVPKLAAVPLDFQPGTQWAYSGGAGPDVLGRIVELVSGQSYADFLRARIFEPLGMKDTSFYPSDAQRPRVVTLYERDGLKRAANQDGFTSKIYTGAGGGLYSTAEDYLQFAQMLLNGGVLNGKRLLSPRTVELMSANHVGGMFNGKLGRPAAGMGYGFMVGRVEDSVASGLRVSTGSFGWDGAYGTQCWIDPKEKMVTIVMIQTQIVPVQRDFENAVMQAIVE